MLALESRVRAQAKECWQCLGGGKRRGVPKGSGALPIPWL